MNKLKYILLFLIMAININSAIADWEILAVNTNPSASNYQYLNSTNILKMSNGFYSAYGIKTGTNPSITDSNYATLGDINVIVTNQTVDAGKIGGLTAEDIMRVGLQYYFTTNEISYGVITGRTTSLTLPTTTQLATYSGATNGQYLGTYLIKSNDMPSILLKGIYSFKFNGYHEGNSKHVMIGGDLYVYNATNGNLVQEFENTVGSELSYSADSISSEFIIQINITNDIPKDGYAFVLKTKMINNDGYTGNLYSYFGVNYWSGFIMPIHSGVYTTEEQVNSLIDKSQSNQLSTIFRTYQLWSASNSTIMANAKTMRTLDYGDTGVGVWTNTSVTNQQYMYYCSGPSGAGLTLLNNGLYQVSANMYKSGAGNIKINSEIYIRQTNGTLTEIAVGTPQSISTTPLEYFWYINITNKPIMNLTDSIVVGFKASDVTVTPDLLINGGYLNVPVPSSQFALKSDLDALSNSLINLNNTSYWVTNTVVVSNSLEFAIPLVDNRVMLDDIRMYISTTNNSPVSKRASIQLFRNSNRRCDKLVYLDTNQLYWSSLNTVATTAGSTSNTVSDASGVILNDLYYIGDNTITNSFCRPTNTTASIIYWGSTNIYAYTTTSLVSHVNQFGGFPYYDQNNTSQLWFRIQFTTPWTTTVQTVINYGK
jgi:hypothetical protein